MILLAVCIVLATGCTDVDEAELATQEDGQPCKQISDCVAGFDCVDNACTAIESTTGGPQRGDPCVADAECGPDLVCGPQDACTPFPGVVAGAPCGLTVECNPPLVCHGDDSVCVDVNDPNPNDPSAPQDFGIKDIGVSCGGFTECRKPYLCAIGSAAPTCSRLPFYLGPDCMRTDEEAGAFRGYFEIPPETIPEDFEFYRLPFPSDIRLVNGKISLSGHPSPGEVLGIDVAGSYLTAVQKDADGFAINGSIFFRFTDPPTNDSLCLDAGGIYPELPDPPPPCPVDDDTCVDPPPPEPFCGSGGEAKVFLVNVDPDSPTYNARLPVQMATNGERSQYMCQNAVGIGPLDGMPLEHSTTYAAVVTTGIRDIRADPPIQDRDFARVLAADAGLSQEVLDATAPLLEWLADTSIDPGITAEAIAIATVFTTGDPDAIGPKLRAAVHALPAPAFDSGEFECNAPPSSPPTPKCRLPAGAFRDCTSGPAADYYEVHGTYTAPAFQGGTRPYTVAADGGALSRDGNGNPTKVFDETMCYALTVPKGQSMPTGGWPVIIYGHGTGGNYRSFAVDPTGIVRTFSKLGFAVIGIDNVMHGPRQDPAQRPAGWDPDTWDLLDPGRLFFNVLNPRAARDNVLQGSVDLFYLTRLLTETTGLSTLQTGVIQFDASQIYYFGHSQGAIIAPAYLSEESDLRAAIFSGAGAELALSILNKKEPVDISEVTSAFFADQSLSRVHPMMGIVATLFGPSDAVSYAPTMVSNTGRDPRPYLMFWGLGDHFTPDATQASLVRAMGIPLVQPVPMSVPGVEEVAVPLTDNFDGVTAGVVQLNPDCTLLVGAMACGTAFGCTWDGAACSGTYEGHFVTFNHPAAPGILGDFLTGAKNGTARITR
ncbi:MAG: hypothetical protein V3T05_08855 [Myxococcota bacterium]